MISKVLERVRVIIVNGRKGSGDFRKCWIFDDRRQSSSIFLLISEISTSIYNCTRAYTFPLVLHLNCTAVSQSESTYLLSVL